MCFSNRKAIWEKLIAVDEDEFICTKLKLQTWLIKDWIISWNTCSV